MKKNNYPRVLGEGAEQVKIRKINDHGRTAFFIEYYWGGVRKQKSRANEEEALSEARAIRAMMQDEAPKFSDTEGAGILKSAECALAGINIPVDVVCREYADAFRKLGGGLSLSEAVAIALQHRPVRESKNVAEIAEEYLAQLKPQISHVYYVNTANRVRRFAKAFPCPISQVNKSAMDKFLSGLSLTNRSRNSERGLIVSLFNYARTEKFLSNALKSEAEQIKKLKPAPLQIGIFDFPGVEKLLRHLEKNHPEFVPYFVIGVFAAVRPAEIARLDFSAIRWDHGDIEIRADQSKTGTRRLVEMPDNLKAWLAPYRNQSGKIGTRRLGEKIHEIANSIGVKWSSDIMRHSAISYGVAIKDGIGTVALNAGNSEAIIKRHYLKRVTRAEGIAFFGIMPKTHGKIVAYPKAA